MPKRSFWTALGYSAGVATSVALQRRVKRTVRRTVGRYSPADVAASVAAKRGAIADRARQITIDLRGAADEGRRAMRESEAELKREFDPPRRG